MSDDDFFARIDQLGEQVGDGVLSMQVEVDQVYAIPQERGFWETGPNAGVFIRNHPGGGQTHALRDSIYEPVDEYMGVLAEHAITEDGSSLPTGAEHVAEDIASEYSRRAPIEVGDLRASTHPTVTDDGVTIYDRPPVVPRLSRSALDEKHRAVRRGEEDKLFPGGVRHFGPEHREPK